MLTPDCINSKHSHPKTLALCLHDRTPRTLTTISVGHLPHRRISSFVPQPRASVEHQLEKPLSRTPSMDRYFRPGYTLQSRRRAQTYTLSPVSRQCGGSYVLSWDQSYVCLSTRDRGPARTYAQRAGSGDEKEATDW